MEVMKQRHRPGINQFSAILCEMIAAGTGKRYNKFYLNYLQVRRSVPHTAG